MRSIAAGPAVIASVDDTFTDKRGASPSLTLAAPRSLLLTGLAGRWQGARKGLKRMIKLIIFSDFRMGIRSWPWGDCGIDRGLISRGVQACCASSKRDLTKCKATGDEKFIRIEEGKTPEKDA